MLAHPHSLYWLVVGCETAFWVVLTLALVCRYLLQLKRVSRGLLVLLPALDLALLALAATDLRNGTTATFAHGLAAAYVGFTVAFGSLLVRWADARFSHWFASGPAPAGPAARAWPAVKEDLWLWLRCVMAWVITLSLVNALVACARNAELAQAFDIWYRIAFGSVVLWFVLGPCWSLARAVAGRRDA